MLKVGLTGNIGSGKSTVAMVFGKLGIPVFHADSQARLLLEDEKIKSSIREVFGDDIFTKHGEVNRQDLARIVFVDPLHLEKLNHIIHPAVREKYNLWLHDQSGVAYTLYEAAILFESGHYREMDRIICVTAPENIRINRVMIRDGITEQEVRKRMNNQWNETEIADKADFVVKNDGSMMITQQVLAIHHQLIKH